MIEYDDFVIQIGPPIDGYHSVTVIASPAGKGGKGRFPVSLLALGASTTDAGTEKPGAAGAVTRDFRAKAAAMKPPTEMGHALFDALFTDEIASLFEQSFGKTLAKGRRLRIRLQLNVENASIAPLATLPWELMYRHDRREFLVLSPHTTIVRSLDVPIGAYDSPEIAGPVRVLFVMSNPRGDLNLEAERAEIAARLALDLREQPASRAIVADFLEDATFAALEDRLRDKDYHIIHFMGHGAFDERHQGHLLFQDGMRSGADLGDSLKRERMTRLVTLNACRTAEGSGEGGADPFAGVAAALVMAGVPAVVAMQFPVSDTAAIAFSARLYSSLGRGEPLEEAVDSGRMRIKALAPDQREWATPVLFLGDPAPFREMVFNAPTVAPAPSASATAPAMVTAPVPPPPLTPPPSTPSSAVAVPPRSSSRLRTLAIGVFGGVLGIVVLIVVSFLVAEPDPKAPDQAAQQSAPANSTAVPIDQERVGALQAKAAQNPADVESRRELGTLFSDAERYEEALPWWEQALTLEPDDPTLSCELGRVYSLLNQPDRAMAQYEHSLSIDPKNPRTLVYKGIALADKQDLKGAAVLWEQAVKIAPNTPEGIWAKESLAQMRHSPSAGEATPIAAETKVGFTLENQTGFDLHELYVTPNNVSSLGEDVLGDFLLENGGSKVIAFKTISRSCAWDLVAKDEKSREIAWRDIDLCGNPSIALFYQNGQPTSKSR